jgi:tellurite resistance protein
MVKIETATIRRLRDALLQSGRRESDVVSSAHETLTREGLLSEPEQRALERVDPVVETMYLVMTADGRTTSEERDAIRGAIRGLTDGLLQDGTIKVMLESYHRAVDAHGRDERLKQIAQAISEDAHRAEGAFALAAAVALADDEVAIEENELVHQLGQWLGITTERAREILDQLEDDRQAAG